MKILKIVVLTVSLFFLTLHGFIRADETETMNEQEKKLAVQSFQYIWETIRDKHYDPDLGGLDWQGVYERFYPEILRAETKQTVTRIFVKMLDTLELSHFTIIPGFFYDEIEQQGSQYLRMGTLGCETRVLENRAYIVRLLKGFPARKAGLSYGNEIISINNHDLISDLQMLGKKLAFYCYRDLILSNRVNSFLRGEVGDTIKIVYRDGKNDTCCVQLAFAEPAAEMFQLGFFPPAQVWIETDTISSQIGYVAFNAFMDPVNIMPVFNSAIKNFMNFKGIIIDLRGNPGGLLNMVQGMGGWFIAENGKNFGSMCYRHMSLKIAISPRPVTYRGKVAILIDGLSACASEIMAAGLRDAGRARMFGCPSAGAALGSSLEKLPNGDGFQYAFACYMTAGGEIVEGGGLEPDVIVPLTPRTLLEGIDPVVNAAVKWIETEDPD
jgi:carboxyl-terminal processing protease